MLDCGAGGDQPPLSLFKYAGYHTCGIERAPSQVEKARCYGKAQGQELGIVQGDMTQLPFDSAQFDAVYSYNSVFHMTKADVITSLQEMVRVLKPGGLMFVNVLSTKDFRYGQGQALGQDQFDQQEDGQWVTHSYFHDDELAAC